MSNQVANDLISNKLVLVLLLGSTHLSAFWGMQRDFGLEIKRSLRRGFVIPNAVLRAVAFLRLEKVIFPEPICLHV